MKILIADDDTILRNELAELLREDGHDVVGASDGGQALRLVVVAFLPLPETAIGRAPRQRRGRRVRGHRGGASGLAGRAGSLGPKAALAPDLKIVIAAWRALSQRLSSGLNRALYIRPLTWHVKDDDYRAFGDPSRRILHPGR